jgi:hypothetical protein
VADTTDEAMIDRLLMPEAEAPEVIEDEVVQEEATAEVQEEVSAEPDEVTEAVEVEAPQKYTVKVDGTETEVTLDDLKRSFSGQAYIQKGMAEAAETRKRAAEMFQTLQAQQEQFLAVVQTVQQQGFKAPPQEPDMAMMDKDPIGYMQADARYRKEMAEYQTQQQQLQHITAQRTALQQQAQAEFVREQSRLLAEKIPEFSDAAKAREIAGKIRRVGAEVYGFNDAELDGIVDARHVQVLHDAAKWRELQASKATAPKPAPRTVVPSARQTEPAQLARARAIEKARKSGNPDDFVNLLLKP